MKATVLANPIALRSFWISTASFYGPHEPGDNGWHTPYDSPSAPGLPSTPQSSWQPYSNTNTAQGSWVFRWHVLKQPDEPAAVKPMVLGPPDAPAPSKPIVPEVNHPVQHRITPKPLLRPHSDTEILSYIDEDTSSTRDGYTAWVMSHLQRWSAIWRPKRPTKEGKGTFANMNLPIPPGPAPLWGPRGVPGEWADMSGFIRPPGSETEWHIRMHGAFEIPHGRLGIKVTDQSCHHEVWIHPLHVINARLIDRTSRDGKYRRPSVRKRNSPYDHNKEKRQSR